MSIIKYIKDRWSPRAFSKRSVNQEQLNLLFEAASWAPSSMNEQPWKYYYSFKGEDGFDRMLDCLLPGNTKWARNASILVLSLAVRNFDHKNRPNRHAAHDVGAANALLSLQASSMGFQVHQMGGFDIRKTKETFMIDPEILEPITFIALGYPGDAELLEPELRKLETKPRERKELQEFSKHFG